MATTIKKKKDYKKLIFYCNVVLVIRLNLRRPHIQLCESLKISEGCFNVILKRHWHLLYGQSVLHAKPALPNAFWPYRNYLLISKWTYLTIETRQLAIQYLIILNSAYSPLSKQWSVKQNINFDWCFTSYSPVPGSVNLVESGPGNNRQSDYKSWYFIVGSDTSLMRVMPNLCITRGD